METVKLKTAELNGAALDWAVACAAGRAAWKSPGGALCSDIDGDDQIFEWSPSTNWGQAGPLIEKFDEVRLEKIGDEFLCFVKQQPIEFHHFFGETALIAFCRCLVMLKLCDEVEVPVELVK